MLNQYFGQNNMNAGSDQKRQAIQVMDQSLLMQQKQQQASSSGRYSPYGDHLSAGNIKNFRDESPNSLSGHSSSELLKGGPNFLTRPQFNQGQQFNG